MPSGVWQQRTQHDCLACPTHLDLEHKHNRSALTQTHTRRENKSESLWSWTGGTSLLHSCSSSTAVNTQNTDWPWRQEKLSVVCEMEPTRLLIFVCGSLCSCWCLNVVYAPSLIFSCHVMFVTSASPPLKYINSYIFCGVNLLFQHIPKVLYWWSGDWGHLSTVTSASGLRNRLEMIPAVCDPAGSSHQTMKGWTRSDTPSRWAEAFKHLLLHSTFLTRQSKCWKHGFYAD